MEYYCLNLGYFAVLGLTLTGKELPKKGIGLPKATISHFPTVQKTPKTPDKCIEPLKPGCSSTLTHRWVLQTAHSTIYWQIVNWFQFLNKLPFQKDDRSHKTLYH